MVSGLSFANQLPRNIILNNLQKEASKNSYREKNVYLYASDITVVRDTRSYDVIAEPMLESPRLVSTITIVNKSDIIK